MFCGIRSCAAGSVVGAVQEVIVRQQSKLRTSDIRKF